jgi:hypothetical protein
MPTGFFGVMSGIVAGALACAAAFAIMNVYARAFDPVY